MIDGIDRHEHRAGARIARLREHRKLTQTQLADACGMTRQAISSIELGKRAFRLGEAVAIAEALEIDLGRLVSADPLVLHVHTEVPID
jgi:UDP-N-acetylglucosamine 1-carboxyvinyltransferase